MCKKKKKLKWTQAETNEKNNALINQARNKWITAVSRYNKKLPDYDKMWGHKVAKIQDLSDVDWKDTKLGTLERMLGKAETREGELESARGYTWDDSGAPDRADYGSISLYDRTGARSWDTNIFSGDPGNPALDWGSKAPKVKEAPDVSSWLSGYDTTVSGNISSLEGWIEDRDEAEEKYSTFREGLRGEVGDLYGSAMSATIADKEGLPEWTTERQRLSDEITDWEGPLKNWYDFSQSTGKLGRAETRLATRTGQRTAEVKRLDDLESGWGTDISGWETDFGTYDISNIDKMDALKKSLRGAERDIGGVKSKILSEYDFSDELGDLSDIGTDLTDLYTARTDELDRIQEDTDDFRTESTRMGSALRRLGTEDLADINEAQDLADEAYNEISGYTSKLDFSDLTALGTKFSGYQTDLTDLLTKRSGELDEFGNKLTGYGTELGGIDLWEERKMEDLMNRITGTETKLGKYYGGRAPGIQSDYETKYAAVESKLGDLYDKRDDLEDLASEYLSEARSGFLTLDDLDDMRTKQKTLLADVNKYDSSQAGDEMTALSETIRNEEARIRADMEAKRKREEEERARANQPRGFMYGLGGRALTPAEYGALMSRRRDDELRPRYSMMGSLLG